MKGWKVHLIALGLAGVFASSARCELHWETTRLTNTTWRERAPKLYGNQVYYNDFRNGAADIYRLTIGGGGAVPVIQSPGTQSVEAIYEDRILYRSYTQEAEGYADLYLLDPALGATAVTTAPGEQKNADMDGDLVVYESYETGVPQVWAWDPVNGNRPLDPTGKPQDGPRVYGGRVVWTDGRNYSPYNERTDVYSWTAEEGVTRLSTAYFSAGGPDIFGDRVLMTVYDTIYPDPEGTWEWREGQGLTPFLPGVDGPMMRTWGDLIAWGGAYTTAYHPSLGVTTLNSSQVLSLDVYSNSVVWADYNYDIWMAQLVPEPSAILSLASFAGLLACLRRRRGK